MPPIQEHPVAGLYRRDRAGPPNEEDAKARRAAAGSLRGRSLKKLHASGHEIGSRRNARYVKSRFGAVNAMLRRDEAASSASRC